MENEIKHTLVRITALASEYCGILENVSTVEKDEFVKLMLLNIPRLYVEFLDCRSEVLSSEGEDTYFSNYVDEDYYDSVRRGIENLLGPDDTFLETFEEDMKYSDTPIAASISESLADIFQPLYNFISVVKDTDGEQILEAFGACQELFDEYWSQTLCNVMRALNNLRVK